MVRRAFERIPLPDSEIGMNPGGQETLVNYPTSFYTAAEGFSETVDFFGGRITIRLDITPSSYTWHHGDGTSATTDHPGRPRVDSDAYTEPDLVIHDYARKARGIPTSVDTTWSATWTLNGRDMGAVPGTVTIEGDPAPIDVLEARPVLVN